MTLDEAPNEGTSLLNNNTTDEAAEDTIHRLGRLTQNSSKSGVDAEDFSRESHSIADMVRTTHNDPDVREVSEDMSKLVGSTQILYNEMEKVTSEKVNASLRKTQAMSEGDKLQSFASTMYQHRSQSAVNFLEKVKTSFFEDAKSLAVGTIPQSIVVAITVGKSVRN